MSKTTQEYNNLWRSLSVTEGNINEFLSSDRLQFDRNRLRKRVKKIGFAVSWVITCKACLTLHQAVQLMQSRRVEFQRLNLRQLEDGWHQG